MVRGKLYKHLTASTYDMLNRHKREKQLLRTGQCGCLLFEGSVGNVLVGVLAEDVSDDYNSLLNHVVDLGLDQVQQGADTALS